MPRNGRKANKAELGQPELGGIATPARHRRGGGPPSAIQEVLRRKGVDQAWTALEELLKEGGTTDKYTVSRLLMTTVSDGRGRINTASIYRAMDLVERYVDQQPRDVDAVLFNAVLDTCCRLKDLNRLEATMQKMRDLKVVASPVTLGVLVKTYGQAGDLPKVLQYWDEMVQQRKMANDVTYGCMLDACIKNGNVEKAVEIFQEMKEAGKHRNTVLYTTLIKGFGMQRDVGSAMATFREMEVEGVPCNTITYNSLIDVCVKCNDIPAAEQLIYEMTTSESAPKPDLITYSTLLKGYCHLGEMDKAFKVSEDMTVRGIRKDELVYNTLMDGCVKANDWTAGIGLFDEMVRQRLRPSAITGSILDRLAQRAGVSEEELNTLVDGIYSTHGAQRPAQFGDQTEPRQKRWDVAPTGFEHSVWPPAMTSPDAGMSCFQKHEDCRSSAAAAPALPTFGAGVLEPCTASPALPMVTPHAVQVPAGAVQPKPEVSDLLKQFVPALPATATLNESGHSLGGYRTRSPSPTPSANNTHIAPHGAALSPGAAPFSPTGPAGSTYNSVGAYQLGRSMPSPAHTTQVAYATGQASSCSALSLGYGEASPGRYYAPAPPPSPFQMQQPLQQFPREQQMLLHMQQQHQQILLQQQLLQQQHLMLQQQQAQLSPPMVGQAPAVASLLPAQQMPGMNTYTAGVAMGPPSSPWVSQPLSAEVPYSGFSAMGTFVEHTVVP